MTRQNEPASSVIELNVDDDDLDLGDYTTVRVWPPMWLPTWPSAADRNDEHDIVQINIMIFRGQTCTGRQIMLL